MLFVDSVTNTMYGTVDASKNMASSVYEKGSSLVGAAKGSII